MTGLDPAKDRILEVGAIATDWQLNEVARYQTAVKVDLKLAKERMVGKFWEDHHAVCDALLEQNETARPSKTIEKELLDFIEKNFDTKKPIYLSGNSIHQDQKFIEREWPLLNAKLHYRMLDVSSWKIVFENRLRTKINKPEAHRALDDIEGSIDELKVYLNRIK